MEGCLRVLKQLKSHRSSWAFREPVDAVGLGIPHYLEIITQPMDLSTMEKNLLAGEYSTPTQFHADLSRIITNSYTFNAANPDFTRLTADFETAYLQASAQEGLAPAHTPRPPALTPRPPALTPRPPPAHTPRPQPVSSISMGEKKELGGNIKKLGREHMKGVLDIVNEGKVKIMGEFDLKELEPHIIRKLQQYVKQRLAADHHHPPHREESSFEIDDEDDS